MKQRVISFHYALFVWLVLITLGISLDRACAQVPNQVGLVVHFGDDSTITRCIEFNGAQINGYDVLLRSGLNIVGTGSAGGGMAVCKIEDIGCPTEDCFCKCKGSTCIYWSYWHLVDGSWQYSTAGASGYTVHPDEVEGWSWGTSQPPPLVPFEHICAPPPTSTPASTDTPVPTATWTPSPAPTPTDTPSPTATSTPLPTSTDTPLPTATWTPLPSPTVTNILSPTATWTPSSTPTAQTIPPTAATPSFTPTLTNTPEPTATAVPAHMPSLPAVQTMKPIAPTPTQIAMAVPPLRSEPTSAPAANQQRPGMSSETINTILFFALLIPLVIGWLAVQIRQRRD